MHRALDEVARERLFIELIEAPKYEQFEAFQQKMITNNWPVFYAVENGRVVGWADISPAANPRFAHRGFLGMGLIASHRGRGIGQQLLQTALEHAKLIALEKVELSVYTENATAISLYKKLGFHEEGLIKHYRKLDGRYFDCLMMAKFI
jgi:RimJ/RimL family protein N-acetyltransferase